MKKLMFAAVLATVCGAVQADAISSDIVGYTQTEATYGYKATGAAFKAIAGGEYDIQDIKPVPPAGTTTLDDWTYYIYELGVGGACNGDVYVWMDAENGDVAESGWYDAADGATPIVRTFKPGEAFVFDVDMDDAAMQSVGKVATSEVVTPAVYGYCAMCNPFAADISIAAVTPVPPAGTTTLDDWTYYIYELGVGGACNGDVYVWMDAENGDVAESGWYDAADGSTPISRTFAPGEGFVFDVDMDDAGAAFTCPFTL